MKIAVASSPLKVCLPIFHYLAKPNFINPLQRAPFTTKKGSSTRTKLGLILSRAALSFIISQMKVEDKKDVVISSYFFIYIKSPFSLLKQEKKGSGISLLQLPASRLFLKQTAGGKKEKST